MHGATPTDIAEVADRCIGMARGRWPELSIDREALLAHLRSLKASEAQAETSEGTDPQPVDHGDELTLALCCAMRDPGALRILEQEYFRQVPQYLGRIDTASDFVDEVTQQLRERLLVATGESPTPRILTYTGRGPLGGWIRVVAVRLALNQKTQRTASSPGSAPDSGAEALAELAMPMEEEVTKQDQTEPFQKALRNALAQLSARERNVLRLRFVDDWSPEDIGTSYGVHRATVARWIAAARETVRSAMADELIRTMGFRPSEFESVVRLIESRLHISLARMS